MRRHPRIRHSRSGTWILIVAALLLAGGCSLLPEKSPAEQRPTDAMGEGLRGIPDDQGAADSLSSKKQPFWEKYRDKRVRQIEGNLNVE